MELVLDFLELPVWTLRQGAGFCRSFVEHIKDHFVPHHRNNYHPHIFSHSMTGLLSGLLITVKIFTVALLSFGPVIPALSSAITTANIINLTNQSRQANQLNPLTENSILDQAAQTKANDMLAKGYFSHNTPDGKTPWSFIQAAGYNYIMAGENLAVNFTEAENVETAWMNSPGHKANILNKNFEEIGIGISQGSYQDHTAIFVVQMFGTPAEQKITLSDRPTQVAAQPAPSLPVPTPAVTTPATPASASPKIVLAAPTPPLPVATLPVLPLSGNLEIKDIKTQVTGNSLNISVTTSDTAAKVLLQFGQQAIMLEPKDNNLWLGQVDLSRLAGSNANLRIQAFNIKGDFVTQAVGSFASSTVSNFNILGAATQPDKVSWLGKIFDPKAFANQFYLLFIAGILTSLIVAIAVRRHIQHVAVVANGSFLAIVACLLWLAA